MGHDTCRVRPNRTLLPDFLSQTLLLPEQHRGSGQGCISLQLLLRKRTTPVGLVQKTGQSQEWVEGLTARDI